MCVCVCVCVCVCLQREPSVWIETERFLAATGTEGSGRETLSIKEGRRRSIREQEREETGGRLGLTQVRMEQDSEIDFYFRITLEVQDFVKRNMGFHNRTSV